VYAVNGLPVSLFVNWSKYRNTRIAEVSKIRIVDEKRILNVGRRFLKYPRICLRLKTIHTVIMNNEKKKAYADVSAAYKSPRAM
jgi:hypothetical protein